MRKEKMIVSLVIMMLIFAICSLPVFAANTTNNVVTITANTTGGSNNNSSNNAASNNAASNNAAQITAGTNSANTNASNTNTSSSYSTNNSSNETEQSLPYTGTSGHAVIFVIIAVVVSAIYAYKKVKEYNV